jgi:hypothetical protein
MDVKTKDIRPISGWPSRISQRKLMDRCVHWSEADTLFLIIVIAILIGFPAARLFVGSILLGVFWLFVVAAVLAAIGSMFG